jgi:hypothetical protein
MDNLIQMVIDEATDSEATTATFGHLLSSGMCHVTIIQFPYARKLFLALPVTSPP